MPVRSSGRAHAADRARASPTSLFFSPCGRFSYLANSASTSSHMLAVDDAGRDAH